MTGSRHTCATIVSALLTVVILTSVQTRAGGRLRLLRLDRPRSTITVSGSWVDRDYADEDFESETFRTYFRTDAKGSILHPTLFSFSLGATLTHIDYDYETGTDRADVDEDFLGYDFHGTILKERNYPLQLFASKHVGEREQPFAASTKVEDTTYGFDWRYRKESVSFNVAGSKHRQTQENYQNSGLVLDARDTLWSTGAQWTVGPNDFLVRYSHLDAENSLTGSHSTTENMFGQHSMTWGEKDWCVLTSRVASSVYDGLNSLTTFNWTERLKLTHTEYFNTYYAYEATTRETTFSSGSTTRMDTEGFETGLYHRVFRSLFTTASLGFRRHTYETTERDYLTAKVSVNYQKRIPSGKFGISLGQAYQRTEAKSSGNSTLVVFDESHTFTDPFPIVISRRNVQLTSVEVTDSSGATIYLRDVDYSLAWSSDRLEIHRITSGSIADGQAVLVDYVYDLSYSATSTSHTMSQGIRHSFNNGISVYYNHTDSDYDADPETVEDHSFENHVVGVGYNRRQFSARYEYRNHDSSYPFDSHTVTAGCNLVYMAGMSSSMSAGWTLANHEQPVPRDVELLTLQMNNTWRISSTLSLTGSAQYRNERDSLYGNEEGSGMSLGLDWRRRYTSFSILAQKRRYDAATRTETSSIKVELRRKF